MNYWLLIIPFISAIFGWLGSWAAGKILTHRIIPNRQKDLAESIGRQISNEVSFTDIENKIANPDNIQKIMPLVEDHVDDFLRNKLKAKMPVVGMLIGEKTINSLKEVFLKEIEELFPEVLKQFTGNLQSEINIQAMVVNKITNVSAEQLEKTLSPALNYFRLTGTITGFVIGVINLVIILLLK